MKRIAITLAAALLVAASGAALAQPAHDDHAKPAAAPAPAATAHGPAMAGPAMSMHGPAGPAMQGPAHADWKEGGHIGHDDWGRGAPVDYREHHLRKPPRGYEWRQVDGNFVLAAAATGLIASIIVAH